ncbi:TetR/AcrR family transcriptional regulator [Kitasatospora saccharophila]|uniref:TetR/AcrR family transcriptional regulator n=1 Tax=Kitasatospora saccharophila TaxID=407973 RepID=A0ABN2Y1T9_9ACTN
MSAAATGRTATRRPADRREQIIKAASELFCERGFHNVSTADVAAAVGITAPALYRHFRNKQDLLLQVVTSTIDAIAERVAGSADLGAYLQASATRSLDRRGAATLWQREGRHLPEEHRAELRRRLAGIARDLGVLVRRESPDLGEADGELLAWCVLSVFGSVSGHRFSVPRKRFEQLLIGLAEAAVHCPLGQDSDRPAAPVPAAGVAAELAVSQRERLLHEAIRLFDERGFQSVSTDDIGEAADASGPSLYKHYPSKTDLLVAAVVRAGEQRRAGTNAALAKAATPQQGLDLLLRSYIDFARDHSHLIGLLISERDQLPEKQQREARQTQRDYIALWLHVLEQVRPGLDQAEAKIIVSAVLAVVDNAVRTASAGRRADLAERLAEIGSALLLPAA